MSNTIILDSVFDPFDVARVIYTELALPSDPDFDDLDTDTRTVLLGMVFDLEPDDPRILAAHQPVNPADFGLTA
ncbi:hypothetical protein [Rhodococcus opacus]|uniref:hypothetical protein n=1 Tax=Rhodococcus opacus TaxID=37919 RepID=UPI0002FB81AD|nr:hypothetical protein [Rhodococcus opacus]AHK35366.1 hypothetical protein Pd630_LPD09126 [Rhodococcus opacus PD630]UDH01657.1 hypothetical protein K2Z90_008085 [Rhodococcus opacus PD630]